MMVLCRLCQHCSRTRLQRHQFASDAFVGVRLRGKTALMLRAGFLLQRVVAEDGRPILLETTLALNRMQAMAGRLFAEFSSAPGAG